MTDLYANGDDQPSYRAPAGYKSPADWLAEAREVLGPVGGRRPRPALRSETTAEQGAELTRQLAATALEEGHWVWLEVMEAWGEVKELSTEPPEGDEGAKVIMVCAVGDPPELRSFTAAAEAVLYVQV